MMFSVIWTENFSHLIVEFGAERYFMEVGTVNADANPWPTQCKCIIFDFVLMITYIGVNLHWKIFYVHTTMFHIQNIPHVRDLSPHWFIVECTFESMQHIAGHAGLSEITLFLIFCFFKAQQESTIEITTHLHSYWQDNPPPTPSPPVLQPLAAETKSTKFTKKMKVLQKPGQHLTNLKRAAGRFERVTGGLGNNM